MIKVLIETNHRGSIMNCCPDSHIGPCVIEGKRAGLGFWNQSMS